MQPLLKVLGVTNNAYAVTLEVKLRANTTADCVIIACEFAVDCTADA